MVSALEQARVNYLGSHGKFTALLKQLGTLSKEEKDKLYRELLLEVELVQVQQPDKQPDKRTRLVRQ